MNYMMTYKVILVIKQLQEDANHIIKEVEMFKN